MPVINNPDLYKKAKAIADEKYNKPSAYKSGFIVKTYKEMGGTYSDDKQPKKLKRWFKEDWQDVGNSAYPVLRPTKRITRETPLTLTEIDPTNLKKQILLKQKIKGKSNLPKFEGKGQGTEAKADAEKEEPKVGDLKPAFCRQGNKYQLRGSIIPLISPHETYVELFAGSGAIFFNKPKAKTNVLNDLDKATMKRFALLKKAPLDPATYNHDLTSLKRIKEFYNHHGHSVQDQILLEKIISCDGFSGKPVTRENQIYKDYNPVNVVKLMKDYHAKLQGVVLTTKDYEDVVKKYDSPTTFFFIDPPYENTSKTFGYAEDQQFDFARLNKVLQSIKGRFLMTINDSKNIRTTFKSFNQKPVDVYTPWGHHSKDQSKRIRKELFITNYQMAKHQISV